MTICSVCGRELRAGEQVCPACGHLVGDRNSDTADMAVANASPAEPEAERQNGAAAAEMEPHTSLVGRLTVRAVAPINGGQGREFALDGRPIYIGRSPSCDIVLEGDQLTSRRHALLRYDAPDYVLVDLGSSNGTYINDTEVREATPLRDGDRIIVGEHELLYSTSAAGPEASLPGVERAPVPSQPPSQTNPSMVAVSPMTAAESSVPFPVAVVEYGESNGANAGNDGETESATQEYPAVHPDTWPPAATVSAEEQQVGESDQGDQGDQNDDDSQSDQQEAPAAEEPAYAYVDAPAAPATDTAATADTGDVDLDAMHAQLAQLTAASEMLARRMEEQGRQGERRKAAIEEARAQVESLLAQLDQTSADSGEGEEAAPRDLGELIDVTRQAAENPQHLQYLTRLAEHAGEIADALQQQERQQPAAATTPENIRQALEALRSQLESLG